MAIFLDTRFYLGLIHKKDPHFTQAHQWLNRIRSGEYGQVYTSNYIIVESLTLVAARTKGDHRAIASLRALLIGSLHIASIIRVDESEDLAALDLFEKLSARGDLLLEEGLISFIDCTNIVLCQMHSIEFIASFDRHYKGWLSYIA